MTNTLPIGVFDSGIGGLTVLKTLQHQLPYEKFIYVADMDRLPYGDKTPGQILTYAQEILSWMTHKGVKMAIMACNTSSALALPYLQNSFSFPIVGIIDPTAKAIAQHCRRVGILATQATIKSAAYQTTFQYYNPNIEIISLACPEFVPLIEDNQLDKKSTYSIIEKYITKLIEAKIDTLVYGCTHYPYLSPIIQAMLPSDIQIIDPAEYITKTVSHLLTEHELSAELSVGAKNNPTLFYSSGHAERFNSFGEKWLNQPVNAALIDFSHLPRSINTNTQINISLPSNTTPSTLPLFIEK